MLDALRRKAIELLTTIVSHALGRPKEEISMR